jgi:hypothetical protein
VSEAHRVLYASVIIPRTIRHKGTLAAVLGLAGVALASCGEALPSSAPLSAPTSRSMTRVRPSSSRAIENESEQHSRIETDGSPPNDDDDDSERPETPRGTEGAPE